MAVESIRAKLRTRLRRTMVHAVYAYFVTRAWRSPLWRLKDWLGAFSQPELRGLHSRLYEHLKAQRQHWPHPYGFGYYYQGWDRIGVSGIRSVEERFSAYGLSRYLTADMRLLDVAANTGFMALRCAGEVAEVEAVEINPHLVRIGEEVAAWLEIENGRFVCADFLQFIPERTYDGILSLACHHTDDGNMRPGLRTYLERLHGLLKERGYLFFESHSTEARSKTFLPDLRAHSDLFELRESQFLGFGHAKGGDRVFVVLQKNSSFSAAPTTF